jgi:DNA-binding NarL/FixJ family response regulator
MLSVAIVAADKITVFGLAALLRNEPRLILKGTSSRDNKQIVATVVRQRPDVVLLDFPLAHLQKTFECCRQIRAAAPQTEVVAFTNIEETGIVEQAKAAGAVGVISRTSDPREIVRAVLFAGRHQPYVCSLLSQAPTTPELSARQECILNLLSEGMDTQDIATELSVSTETVKSHVKVILQKLGARGRTHAVAIGIRRALID